MGTALATKQDLILKKNKSIAAVTITNVAQLTLLGPAGVESLKVNSPLELTKCHELESPGGE